MTMLVNTYPLTTSDIPMANKASLTFSLLAGAILAASPSLPIFAAPAPAPTIQQPAQPTSSAVKLTVEDLPPGFQELPPEVTAQIATRLEAFRKQLAQANIKPEDFFAFINPETFQLVMGVTGELPDQAAQTKFDNNVQQFQKPEVQQQLLSQLQASLKSFKGIEVLDYKPLPALNNVANASTGFSLGLKMQDQPLQIDMATFRRNRAAAFTAVMYMNGETPQVGVKDLATKLDNRIVKASPAVGSSQGQ
jgi:hypothetical protein